MVTTHSGNLDQSSQHSDPNRPLLPNPYTEASHASQSANPPTEPAFQEFIAQQMALILSKMNGMDTDLTELKKGKSSRARRETNNEEDEEDEGHTSERPWWTQNPTKRPHTEVKFPKYEGGDPRGWILKADKCFRYDQTPDDLKVDVAAINLEEHALNMFT